MNGIATGSVEANTMRNTPMAPRQSSVLKRASAGGSGSCNDRRRIASSSAGSMIDATTGGSASADEALGPLRVGGLAHGQVCREDPALVGQGAHQIEHRVDDAPGQVAAEHRR